jgi:ribosomal protein L13
MTSNPRFHKPLWHLVDARNQIVGRLATQIVHILRGKHKPTFTPNCDCGDYIVVINAQDVKFTGKKVAQKKYIWHTGYVGGLKNMSVKTLMDRKPEEVRYRILFQFILRQCFSTAISYFTIFRCKKTSAEEHLLAENFLKFKLNHFKLC